jgi:hypothetical protein
MKSALPSARTGVKRSRQEVQAAGPAATVTVMQPDAEPCR